MEKKGTILYITVLGAAFFLLFPHTLQSGIFSVSTRNDPAEVTRALTAESKGTRSLDWSQWMTNSHPISVNGNVTDWNTYTPRKIGINDNDVDLYLANDDSYLFICVDAISDTTDNEQVQDRIHGFFDGNNDDDAERWISEIETNMNTQDNWYTLSGDRQKGSDATDAYNDAGIINKNDNGEIVLWYNQQTWIDEWGYQWQVGFHGNPAHMIYEVKIPLNKWNWQSGSALGFAMQVAKATGGEEKLIGKYPAGFSLQNIGSWKDIHLGTRNDRPTYTNPDATPSTLTNDGVNETVLTVEAGDPDDSVDKVVLDLSAVGGKSDTLMSDDGQNGDQTGGDGIYTFTTSVPSSTEPGTYQLPFTVHDTHRPNVGMTHGMITLTVTQANRPPQILPDAVKRVELTEDQNAEYIDLTRVFNDPDTNDVLSYRIKTNETWNEGSSSWYADYRVLYNSSVKISPLPDRFGTDTLFIKAVDAEGLSVDSPHRVLIAIKPVNDPPEIVGVNDTDIRGDSVSLIAKEDRWSSYVFRTEDIDQDPLIYDMNISQGVPGLRRGKDFFFYRDNGTFNIFPLNEHVGDYGLKLEVDDGNGGSDSIDVDLRIENSNDPPILEEISTKYVKQDEWLRIAPYAEDEDKVHGDTLTFSTNFSSEVGLPWTDENIEFDEESGELRFKPDTEHVDTYHTYIEVKDGDQASVRRDFKVIVINKNDPPQQPTFTYSKGDGGMNVTFNAGEVPDPDGDVLIYQWFFGDGKQRFGQDLREITHTYSKDGHYTVELTVFDGELSNTATKDIEIKSGDRSEPGKKYGFGGRVIGEKGQPISGASVIVAIKEDAGYIDMIERTTDDGGNFQFLLPPNRYKVEVSKENYDTNTTELTILDGEVDKDFVLYRPNRYSGGGDTKKGGIGTLPLDEPIIWVLIASVVLVFLAIILLLVIKKRKTRKEEEAAMPHHIPKPSGSQTRVAAQPRQIRKPPKHPPDTRRQAVLPGSGAVPAQGRRALPQGKLPTREGESTADGRDEPSPKIEGKMPEEEKKKPRIVKPSVPRPPRLKGKRPPGSPEEKKKLPSGEEEARKALPAADGELKEDERSGIGKKGTGEGDEGETRIPESETEETKMEDEVESARDDRIFPKNVPAGGIRKGGEGDGDTDVSGDKESGEDEVLLKNIFQGLEEKVGETLREAEDTVDDATDSLDATESLGKIPVKRVAISKETGNKLELCEDCGRYFEPSEIECPYCERETKEEEEIECPSCGAQLDPGMIFCNKCGGKVKGDRALREAEEEEGGDKDGPGEGVEEDAGEEIVEQVECYKCGDMMAVYTEERPLIVNCPTCGTPGKLL